MEEGRGLLSLSSSSSEMSVPSEEADAAGAEEIETTGPKEDFWRNCLLSALYWPTVAAKEPKLLKALGQGHHKPPLCLSLTAPRGGLQHWNSAGMCSSLSLPSCSSRL